jgi:hypothetical protein
MPLQTKKSVTERKPRGKRCVVVCEPVECLEEKCCEDLPVVPEDLPVVPEDLPVVPEDLPVVPEVVVPEDLIIVPEVVVPEDLIIVPEVVVPDELHVVPDESLELTPEEFICESSVLPDECLEELPLKMLKEKPLRNEAGCYLNPKTNRYVKEGTTIFKKLVKEGVIVLEVV